MRAAIVSELGQAPTVGERPEPAPEPGGVVVEVIAAALNPLEIAVGSGRYFAGHPQPPYVPGAEAVGRTGDGELVWAFGDGLGLRRDGTFAEQATCAPEALVPVPEGAEPALAAALGIAGLAGWLPLAWRAPVREDDTVLILGATGTAGYVALQAARLLGAGRVVAAGRNPAGLERAAAAGADATVRLADGADLAEEFREACGGEGPTLVFDPLWAEPARAAVEAAAPSARIVNLGQSAGPEATLPSGRVRGKQLDLLGHTNFRVPREVLREHYARLVLHAVAGDIRLDVEEVPLEQVPDAWRRQAEGTDHKLVVVP